MTEITIPEKIVFSFVLLAIGIFIVVISPFGLFYLLVCDWFAPSENERWYNPWERKVAYIILLGITTALFWNHHK